MERKWRMCSSHYVGISKDYILMSSADRCKNFQKEESNRGKVTKRKEKKISCIVYVGKIEGSVLLIY